MSWQLPFDELQELRTLAVLTRAPRCYVYRVPTAWAGVMARRLVKRGLAERAPFDDDDPVYRRDMYRASDAGLSMVGLAVNGD